MQWIIFQWHINTHSHLIVSWGWNVFGLVYKFLGDHFALPKNYFAWSLHLLFKDRIFWSFIFFIWYVRPIYLFTPCSLTDFEILKSMLIIFFANNIITLHNWRESNNFQFLKRTNFKICWRAWNSQDIENIVNSLFRKTQWF